MEELLDQLDRRLSLPPAFRDGGKQPDQGGDVAQDPTADSLASLLEASRSKKQLTLEHAQRAAFFAEVDVGDFCEECGVPTAASTLNLQSECVCPECGQIYEKSCEEEQAQLGTVPSRPPDVRAAPRLRMVGDDASRHQRILDKSAHTDTDEACVSDLFKGLLIYNNEYRQKYGMAYPVSALRKVAETYVSSVRARGVVRSQNKRAILANLVYRECTAEGRTKAQAAQLFQLPGSGLARGETRLRQLGACTEILNADQDAAWIEAAFTKMGLVYRPHDPLSSSLSPEGASTPALTREDAELITSFKGAAEALLECGKKRSVGIEFAPRTRATGAVYAVLRRAVMAQRLPAHWRFAAGTAVPAGQVRGSIEWISQLCDIRRQTVEGFLKTLFTYHSQFAGVYVKYGLFSGRLERV